MPRFGWRAGVGLMLAPAAAGKEAGMLQPAISESVWNPEALLTAAAALGRQLRYSEEYRSFVAAQQEAEASANVRAAQWRLAQAQQAVRQARQTKGDVAAAFTRFQSAQAEFQTLPEIERLIAAQLRLIELLEYVATRLSEASGVDFVQACGQPTGGCCG